MKLRYGTQILDNTSNYKKNLHNNVISSRVKDIILTDKHPLFKEYGGWNSIGTIFIESIKNPIFDSKIPLIPAFPIFPNIKNYPLINELVPILYLTDVNSVENTTSVSAYYLPPVNIWNSVIHNGIPSSNILPSSQTKNYQQTEIGSVNIINSGLVDIDLGQTFNEQNLKNIHPLLPYEGDIIYEGRFGNSLRFGSTVNNSSSSINNNWSNVGNDGDPITIIRNGQKDTITDPWIPIIEDVNNDKSSVYLTSYQQIPLILANDKNDSYEKSTKYENVKKYSKEQIILNSGRLIFNSKHDSIILSSQKSIHLSSKTSINVDAVDNISLVAPKVYLGSSKGNEGQELQSLVLGENLNNLLGETSSFLLSLSNFFKTAIDSAGNPIVSLQQASTIAQTLGQSMKNIVTGNNLLSKQVKTI